MRILLRLRNAQLAQAVGADDLAERIMQLLGRKRDREAGELLIVARRADIVQMLRNDLAPEAVKVRLRERIGHFARAIGTEIHEDNAVAGLNAPVRVADNGLDEFIRHTGGVAGLHRMNGVGILYALAADHGVVAGLDAIPALVAVHAVEAALQRCDHSGAEFGAVVAQLPDIARAARGRNIASVEEAVQVHAPDAAVVRHFHHGKDVPDVAVHTAVRQKTEDMQVLAVCCVVQCCCIDRIFKECPILNGFRNARQILKHDAAGADVRVADFAVAHLPVRQADVQPRSGQLRVRPALQETVHDRGLGHVNGVAVVRLADAVAIENDECDFPVAHSQAPCAVAATIFEKSTGLSDAPPIRPPSISGWASSSAALPAFMEPP